MENCVYCDQPLAETERVRWYSERVHAACYEELLADEMANIATAQQAEQHNEEILEGVS
jgi:hypothetical protein